MSSIKVTNLQHASAASPAIVLASDGTATAQLSSLNGGALSGARNRIINGDMRLDQRNAGASVSNNAYDAYCVDRWDIGATVASKFTAQRSTTAPAGFSHSLLITSSSAFSVGTGDCFYLMQGIEGFNVSDFAFGTASAQTVTLSFWVRSSLTGTFGGALRNKIASADRGYPFTYSISAANTWEKKTITIAGDTSGTWTTDNSCSLTLCFGLGSGSTFSGTAGAWAGSNLVAATGSTSVVGTNGATFYITGVQLEAGSVATPFERRSYGQELALCQRYYFKMLNDTGNDIQAFTLQAYNTTSVFGKLIDLPVPMRATPTCVASGTFKSNTAAGAASTAFSSTTITTPSKFNLSIGGWGGSSGLVAGNATVVSMANNAYIDASAEL